MNSVIFGGKGARNLEWMNVKSVIKNKVNEIINYREQPVAENMKSNHH